MASIRASGSDIGSFASAFRSAISGMARGIGDRVHCGGLIGGGTRASAVFGRWPMAVKDAAAQITPIRAKRNRIPFVPGEGPTDHSKHGAHHATLQPLRGLAAGEIDWLEYGPVQY